jgi:plasmid stabilization system protein ParE
MRRVIVAKNVLERIEELECFLVDELKFSESVAKKRSARLRSIVKSLAGPVRHALCRFRPWREAGYHCVPFEGWVFAYEVLDEGVIIRDMKHGRLLADVVD